MMNGCGCGGTNVAIAGAGPQAVLPLNGILSPQLAGAVAKAPIGESVQIASTPSLAATPETQQSAQEEIFAGQTGSTASKPASKTSGKNWIVIAGVAAATLAAMF